MVKNNMNQDFKKRLQSFFWRLGMMVLAVIVNYSITYVSGLKISPEFTVLLGLIGGEISKYLNTEIKNS